ncbi:MAG: DNA polymerase III subunit beta [Alphaproteobacteria bacterium]
METSFSVKTKDFLHTLSIGGSMAGRNKSIPILDYIKCEIKNGILKVSSYNGEVGVSSKVSLEKSNDGIAPFCCTFSDIMNFVKTIKDDIITIILEDKSYTVRHSKGKATFSLLDAEDFPSLSALEVFSSENKISFSADSDNLGEVLSRALSFVNNDQLRPALNGVYMVVKDETIKVYASDSHRLYSNVILATNVSGEGSIIIPPMTISTIIKSLNSNDCISVCFNEKNIGVKWEDTLVVSPSIIGRFPNVESVIPREYTIGFTFNTDSIMDSLNRVMVAANVASNHLRMSFNALNELEMSAEDLGFNKAASENVTIEDAIGDITIGFKGTYFASCLKAISTDKCRMVGTDNKKAVVFQEINGNEDKVVLLMPVMII